MSAKVSVIIPVYGVEKYIERCARSLFEQTLDDIEYLFIDDCTPDNSITILKNVLEGYPIRQMQVRILNMERNSGQAAVRNFGISNATGEYIIHCDSDDWIDAEMYETMYVAAKQSNADVVVSDFSDTDGYTEIRKKAFPCWDGEITNNLRCWNRAGQLWNKMFKASIYHSDILLPKDNMGEDMALVYQMAYYCKKIVYIEKPFYKFYQNPNSITHCHSNEKICSHFIQTCNNVRLIDKFYLTHNDSPCIKANIKKLKFIERNKISLIIKHSAGYYKIWRNTFPEVRYNIMFDRNFSIKEKIKFLLIDLKFYPRS